MSHIRAYQTAASNSERDCLHSIEQWRIQLGWQKPGQMTTSMNSALSNMDAFSPGLVPTVIQQV